MITSHDDPDLIIWNPPGRCFHCGEVLSTQEYFVWWHGADDTQIVLHDHCAARLALHLASDSLKADLANGKHRLDAGTPPPGVIRDR